jgi:hypothetical protein
MATVGQPTLVLQGTEVPNVSVDPESFFKFTRRLRFPMRGVTNISGLGSGDSVPLRATGVVSKLWVRVTGTVTFGGTITGTSTSWMWPYDLVRAFRVSANGQANLINIPGSLAKVVNVVMNPAYIDAAVPHTVGGSTGVTLGTMSLPAEDWGTSSSNQMGPGATVPATGTYTVDLTYEIPIAFDDKTLVGSIFAQTNATQLTLDIDWETQANLLTLGGSATFSQALQYAVLGEVFSIPQVGGRFVVPDLSAFHSLIAFRTSGLAQGDNEILLPGTGVGRQLMRLIGQILTGTAPGQPLPVTAANFGQLAWRYGGNDTPEFVPSANQLRYVNEVDYTVDMARYWGAFIWDFASTWAFRDSVDEGATTDLRAVINLVNAPTNGVARIVQETLFAAPVGA